MKFLRATLQEDTIKIHVYVSSFETWGKVFLSSLGPDRGCVWLTTRHLKVSSPLVVSA